MSAELRERAARMRDHASFVSDEGTRAAIRKLAAELDARAIRLEGPGATGSLFCEPPVGAVMEARASPIVAAASSDAVSLRTDQPANELE